MPHTLLPNCTYRPLVVHPVGGVVLAEMVGVYAFHAIGEP